MAQSSQVPGNGGWLRASGLQEIARALGLAIHPAKLGLALAGIIATMAYGGLLDRIWKQNGGVPADTIAQYIDARQMGRVYVEPTGPSGIFEAWRAHERASVMGLLGSPVVSAAPATALGSAVERRAVQSYLPWHTNLAYMARGVWWMVRFHPFFFLLFSLGALFIWALVGGAICRIAAVQFARDEKITAREALAFAWKRLVGGFMLAPLIPIAFIVLVASLMIIGGVFLRIPVLGDLLGAPLFVFALLGGLIIALLGVGLVVGGGLFWPAVAVEGSDAFDAFSRSLAYPFSRPWKTVWYFFVVGVYAVISWLVVSSLVYWGVAITRGIVSWGTSPFGWWRRADGATKLDAIWPVGGVSGLHQWPEWAQLGLFDKYSAFVIGIYVVLAMGITWAFLFSFCLSSDTIIYFLLRRDVDGNDTSDIHLDEPVGGGPVLTKSPGISGQGGMVSPAPVTGAPPISTA